VGYSNLEENSPLNLKKIPKHGWFGGKEPKSHHRGNLGQ